MRADGGYVAVLAERPVRRLLIASLAGRLAFATLPLGFVFFAMSETGSSATAGALVAAFAATSVLAPVRGRIVDRHGPRALVAFAVACSSALSALVLAAIVGAPSAVLVGFGGVAGLGAPPLGAFTRAVWGRALREDEQRLQRLFALDSAGEEGALVVAPLVVAAIAALGSPRASLAVAAAGMLAGTLAAARSPLARGLAPAAEGPRARPKLPAALWLVFASLVPPAAALGAIDVAVPAAAEEAGREAAAGILLSAMAIGTVGGSLLAGRGTRLVSPATRAIGLQVVMALGLALAAVASARLGALGVALVLPGAALGALFTTLYVLVDRLSPEGAGTRTFAWLVTANNGGLAAGAAVAGPLTEGGGPNAGLWFAAACAVAGVIPATAAAIWSAREPPQPTVTLSP